MWDVFVLAAISAMETGRPAMGASRVRERAAAQQQTDGTEDMAARRAVSDFWSGLYGFAELGLPRKGWAEVGARHPILQVQNGCLICRGPLATGPHEE